MIVGTGIIILSVSWGAAIIFSCLFAKSDSLRKLIPAVLGVALLLTLILLLIPRESSADSADSSEYDTTVIGRTALLILESVSLVGGLVAIFVLYCMEQIQGNHKDKDM
ncbi:transmembrane protein 218-like [Oscarella lobularis]|uniref:transmembrane protein 218-like n=1 Tax=Oscarella lobularis TaxID=121494 RepID=UPI003313A03F